MNPYLPKIKYKAQSLCCRVRFGLMKRNHYGHQIYLSYDNVDCDLQKSLPNFSFFFGKRQYPLTKLQFTTMVHRVFMKTSSNENIFRVTDPLCGEFTGRWWIPHHKGQWRGALMFSLIGTWTSGWVYNRYAGDLRRHRAHYDVIVMWVRRVIIMSSHETHSASLAVDYPHNKLVMRSCDGVFVVILSKLLNKQLRGQWFRKSQQRSYDVTIMYHILHSKFAKLPIMFFLNWVRPVVSFVSSRTKKICSVVQLESMNQGRVFINVCLVSLISSLTFAVVLFLFVELLQYHCLALC